MTVALIGFKYKMFARLKGEGLPISLLIYNHRLPRTPEVGTTYIQHDALHHMFEQTFASDLDDEIANNVRQKAMTIFSRTHYRTFARRADYSFDSNDVTNHFENALQYYWNILKSHSIKLLIFANVPHGGSSIVLYHLAKELGLHTVMLMQSLEPNRFWASEDITTIGTNGPKSSARSEIRFNKTPPAPFYMKGTQIRSNFWFLAQQLFQLLNIAMKSIALQPLYNRKSWHKSFVKLSQLKLKKSFQRKNESIAKPFDKTKQFVYFPLHLQPEMTTDVLGRDYADQLRAIEELSRWLPNNFTILVKDNPKQTSYLRGDEFYRRLDAVPNLQVVSLDQSSTEIIAHSTIVATITGTAGWEAIQMGKPVIVFGDAWYRNIPGVYCWDAQSPPSFKEITEHTMNETDVKTALAEKAELLWPGIIDTDYIAASEEFSANLNDTTVTQSIMGIAAPYLEPKTGSAK